jgi:beta-galactosidase
MVNDKLQNIFYGGDYYPEQWDEKIWTEDIRLMKKAGVNLVSLGIFAWALLQPDENHYDFSWLDKIIDLLYKNNIFIDLATSTASQPAWASVKYPEMLPVDEKGNRFSYSSRQSYCPNSPDYRRLAADLTEKITKRYKDHPALVLWHVNNEYGCHAISCYCKNCEKAFRLWLKEKYGTVENLNYAWGTKFWSQYYYNWEEINLPQYTTAYNNPGQMLDYRRFFSDSTLDLYKTEYNIIKKYTPHIKVTTNFVPIPNRKFLDQIKWAEFIEIISIDQYPESGIDPIDSARYNSLVFDMMRGMKDGKPFILMEQSPSQVNWRPVNSNKRPGVMRLWSYEALSLGADGIMFFQWRQSLKGAEKFHSAVVTHTGDENSRVFKEAEILGNELKKLFEIIDSKLDAKAAILFDFENWWALENDPAPTKDLKYYEQILKFHDIFFDLNISVDVISSGSDFSKYEIVVAPVLYMIKNDFQTKIKSFVSKGGYFITTFFSGIVNENDIVFEGGYPGVLKNVLGIKVEEFNVLIPEISNKIKITGNKNFTKEDYNCNMWFDVIHTVSAKPVAEFENDYISGMPAVTENKFENGKSYYIGTQTEKDFLKDFFMNIFKEKNLQPVINTPQGIQVSVRSKDGKNYIFILNHNDTEKEINLKNEKYTDLISGNEITGNIKIKAKECLILT